MTRRLSILELRSVRGTGGGPEKTILLGAERRDRARFDVTICYLRHAGDEVFTVDQWARRMGVDYVELRERGAFDRRIWRDLLALVRDRAVDIVHAHDYKTDLLAYALARRTSVLPLATAHGWTGQTAKERYLYYPLDKRLLGRFGQVIAVSSEIKVELVRHGARADRIAVILNGIDPKAFRRFPDRREPVRERLALEPGDVAIGAIGRLERQKRFDLLIEAFASAQRTEPRLRLIIAGGGSLSRDLHQQAARLGVAAHVRLLGHRDDVVDLHHAFDLFVQSSEYEGTPNAVLEAMALETAIVATDAGGTAELVCPDVHALIVPAGDGPALARAILDVCRHPAAARARAAAARRRVETDLSFDGRTRRLERLYLNLVAWRDAAGAVPISSPHDA
jgi:glycosyltransferase involved in cell wall biosynthesis